MALQSGVMASNVEVCEDRVNRTYRTGDVVSGVVAVRSHQASMALSGASVVLEGATRLHLNARNVGLLEAFYSNIEPQLVFRKEVVLSGAARLVDGKAEWPFRIELSPSASERLHGEGQQQQLCETYHGVYIQTEYVLRAEVTRGLLSTNLLRELEVLVEVPSPRAAGAALEERARRSLVPFTLTSESVLRNSAATLGAAGYHQRRLPRFRISGALHRTLCAVSEPLTGELIVEESDVPIASIELQLVRLESVAFAEGVAQEATEVQNLQVGDGDVCRQLVLPLYAVFPRLFTCPTMLSERFKVEFELNIIVLFKDGTLILEQFPLTLYRPPTIR
jgi:hypothetical protein